MLENLHVHNFFESIRGHPSYPELKEKQTSVERDSKSALSSLRLKYIRKNSSTMAENWQRLIMGYQEKMELVGGLLIRGEGEPLAGCSPRPQRYLKKKKWERHWGAGLLGKGRWNMNANHGEHWKRQCHPWPHSVGWKLHSPWKKATNTATFRSLVKMYFSWKKQKNALCPGTGQEYVLLPEPELVRSRDSDDAMDTVCA